MRITLLLICAAILVVACLANPKPKNPQTPTPSRKPGKTPTPTPKKKPTPTPARKPGKTPTPTPKRTPPKKPVPPKPPKGQGMAKIPQGKGKAQSASANKNAQKAQQVVATYYANCMIDANFVDSKMNICNSGLATNLTTLSPPIKGDVNVRMFKDMASTQAMNNYMKTCTSRDKKACRTTAEGIAGKVKGKQLTAAQKQAKQREAGMGAVESAMSTCMAAAKTKQTRDTCKTKTAKEALVKSLGRNVTNTEMNKFRQNAAKDAVRKSMEVCTKAATTESDKYACRTTAKEALALALGQTVNETTSTQLNLYLQGAATQQVEREMKACMQAAKTEAARKACREQTAVKALKSSLGRNVTSTELNLFMQKAAGQKMREDMDACMKAAGTNSTMKKMCRDDTAKASLAASLGKDPSKVTPQELSKFKRKAGEDAMRAEMEACMDTLGKKPKKSEVDKCTKKAREAFTTAQGLDANAVSNTKLNREMERSAMSKAQELMDSCMADAKDKKARAACMSQSKSALAKVMGATSMSKTSQKQMMNKMAATSVSSSIDACMKSAKTDMDRAVCRDNIGKSALAKSLGKDETEVTQADLQKFMQKGALDTMGKGMSTCMDLAKTKASRDACKKEAKGALAKTLGLGNVTDTEYNKFKKNAAKSSMADVMVNCAKDAGKDKKKLDQCKNDNAMKEMARQLGKTAQDIKPTDFRQFIKGAAETRLGDDMKACMQEAGNNKTMIRSCQDVAKETLKATLGKTSISEQDTQEFIKRGARNAMASGLDACMKTVQEGDKAAMKACKDEAKVAIAQGLGKPASEITDTDRNEFIYAGARKQMKDAIDACFDAAKTKADKKKCASNSKAALARALGKDLSDVDDTDAERFAGEAAVGTAASIMKSCMETANTTSARNMCKKDIARAAIAKAQGKDAEDLPLRDLQEFLNRGARTALKEAMSACKAAKKTPAQCKSENGKTALATALGKDPKKVKAHEVNVFIAKAAKNAMGDKITACSDAAAGNRTKLRACKGAHMKEALAAALGKAGVDSADVEKYIRSAARDKVGETMQACAKVAGGDKAALKRCKGQKLRDSIKAAIGASNVTVRQMHAHIFKAAVVTSASKMEACMTAAGTNATMIRDCKVSTRAAIAAALGKTAGDMTESDFQEKLQKGAQHKVVETAKGCMEAATTAANRTECAELSARALASGLGQTLTTSRRGAKAEDPSDKSFVKLSQDDAAAEDSTETIEACRDAAKTEGDKSTLTDKENTACKTKAKAEMNKVRGQSGSANSNDAARIMGAGAANGVAEHAKACKATEDDGDTPTDCSPAAYAKKLEDGMARNPKKGETADQAKTRQQRAKKRGSKALVKQAFKACIAQKSAAADIKACVKAAVKDVYSKLANAKTEENAQASANKKRIQGYLRGCMASSKPAAGYASGANGDAVRSTNFQACLKQLKAKFKTTSAKDKDNTDAAVEGQVDSFGAQKPCDKTCRAEALENAKALGGKTRQKRQREGFNAVRSACKTHVACKDAGTKDETCETQAKATFVESNGVEKMWDTVKDKVKKMSAFKRNGGVTKLMRKKSMDVDVEVPVTCAKFDADKMVKDVEAKAKADDAAAKATKQATFAPDGDTTKCAVRVKCTAGSNRTDTEIENNADKLAKHSFTVATKTGRRLLSTATVFATQTVEEDSPVTPTPAPAPAPTPAASATSAVITHDLTFAKLTNDQWEGDTKAVYEVGYGIGIGIYDETKKDWKANCKVTSKIKARRGITVEFKATVPSTLSAAAEKTSKALDATQMVQSIDKAKVALNKPNVVAPKVTDIKVAKPKVTSPVVSGASAAATASFASLAVVLMALRH